MITQVLRDCRKYEEEKEQFITEKERPAFHLSSRAGWMNDPNGFSYYKGQYHMFYQYHPFDSHWGPMHWGHAVSNDLLHWTYLPAAMAPDMPYDRNGCFSGCAIELPDGQHLLMYTGVIHEYTKSGEVREVQTQCLAFGDGMDYTKYEGNPVLTEKDLPLGGSRYAFRDPKIWKHADGTYRCMIANNRIGHGGRMLLYKSEDCIHWEFVKSLVENNYRLGLMWECPDFFELDGKQVLLASSQDMLPKGLEYHNGNGTFYMIGKYDQDEEVFKEETNHSIDYGIDFYAPQTVLTPDGRRIMIGWMQNWDTCNLHTASIPWFGQMSLPRELSIKNGVLYQTPIREFNDLRCDERAYEEVKLEDDEIELPGIDGRMIDLTIDLKPQDPMRIYQKFALRFAQDDQFHTAISFRPHESTLKINRKFSGSRRAILHQRRAYVNHNNGALRLRLILDRYSAEVFVNDGEKVMSVTITTDLSAKGISFFADGALIMDIVKYTIDPKK